MVSLDRPGVGTHDSISESEYHALPYLSRSQLVRMRRSPEVCLYGLTEDVPTTPAMLVGRAYHTQLLEPDLFDSRFATAPTSLKRKGSNEWKDWAAGLDEGVEVLPAKDADLVREMAKAAKLNVKVSDFLDCEGANEFTAIWDDQTDVRLRARVDRYFVSDAGGVALDLKTTVDASPEGFARAVAKYDYHIQAAFYSDGLIANGLAVDHFGFFVQEKEAPYPCAIYLLPEGVIEQGRREYRALLARFVACQEAGEWPGFNGGEIGYLDLPSWRWDATRRDLESEGGAL